MSLVNLNMELTDESSSAAPTHCDKHSTSSEKLVQTGICRITENVYTLPENWPKIPQLKDHLWLAELSNCKTPSVKRAVSYIKLMQNIIDEWFLRMTEEAKSRKGSQYNSAPGAKKQQLKFQTAPGENDTIVHDCHSYRPTSTSRVLSSVTTDTSASRVLSISGHGGHAYEEDDTQETPNLGAHEVIEEVITLIAELENDRMETHEKYIKEIKRADWLRRKIDELQLRHLQELPALVQREHEACIMDLTELHWHVTYTKRLQAKAQDRFSVANRHNVQLKEGIDFVKQHVPLVQEKLVLEVEAMDKIRKAQGDADQELVMVQQRQAKTKMRSQEAVTKANTERGYIKQELESAKEDLKNISEQLAEAQMTFKAYVDKMNDIHRKLADNEREMEVLKVKNENARISEEKQATKVRDLQAKVTEAEFDYNHLENGNQQKEHESNMKKDLHIQMVTELGHQRLALEVQLQKVTRKNLEKAVEIQDCDKKIAICNQQKAADMKNITRINKEMEKTTSMLEQTVEQQQHVTILNTHLQDQLQSEQDKASQTEEKLKKTAESIRRQVQDEIHTRTVLQARISSDLAETEKAIFESSKKKEKAKIITDELEQAVSVVLEKVNKLQVTRKEMQHQKEDLATKIKETEKQHKDSSERFNQTLGKVEPQHQALKSELNNLEEQLQTMEQQSVMMKNKIEDMDAAQNMMDRFVKRSEQEIQILTAEMQELNLQIEAGRQITEDLRRQFNDTLERLRSNESKHENLQKERQQVLRKQETDKAHLMEKNTELASRYRQLQKEYILQKERMLKSYDERVKFEAAITDIKQLKSLQSKLHGALVEYFKLRGLYSEAELSKLEQESSVNGVRVSKLQVNMERALDDIAQFLCAQNDEKMAKKLSWEAVKERKDSSPIQPFEVGIKTADSSFGVEVGQN